MSFADIPVRQNGFDHRIEASWFNIIRTKLVESLGQTSYYFVQPTQTLDNGDEFTFSDKAFMQLMRVQSSGGSITLDTLPFGSSVVIPDGRLFEIVGLSDTNTVIIPTNDAARGCIFNGASVELKRWHVVKLLYMASENRFVELYRNF